MKKIPFIGATLCLVVILLYAAGHKGIQSHFNLVPGEVTRMKINKVDIPLRNDGAVFEGVGPPDITRVAKPSVPAFIFTNSRHGSLLRRGN